jgi:hypothetical protein
MEVNSQVCVSAALLLKNCLRYQLDGGWVGEGAVTNRRIPAPPGNCTHIFGSVKSPYLVIYYNSLTA